MAESGAMTGHIEEVLEAKGQAIEVTGADRRELHVRVATKRAEGVMIENRHRTNMRGIRGGGIAT